jgi:5-methyltetrahydrofolate--homocysteine methyltransferase
MGTSVEKAVRGLEAAGADVVGSNCGTGIEDMVKIARVMVGATRLPILIQPNAGLPESRDGRVVYNETPDTMAARVPDLLGLGVAIVGGCCGTTPDHTRAIRRAVEAWKARALRAGQSS